MNLRTLWRLPKLLQVSGGTNVARWHASFAIAFIEIKLMQLKTWSSSFRFSFPIQPASILSTHEISQEVCPPRVVKNFRIIVVQDACTRKYPGNRKALLNVWDVLHLSFSEGSSPGSFEIGQRFMVSHKNQLASFPLLIDLSSDHQP